MKKMFFPSAFCLLIGLNPFGAFHIANAQTAVLYNADPNFYADGGAIIFVDGDIVNDASGHIKNKGDIYLTKDWTNNEAVGGLDPTTGKVILKGNAQIIKGTQTTTFNNLDCQNGNTKTLNITTIVGGNTGVLSLNSSTFVLNSKTLIVTNPLPAAVTRTSGYIVSETDPTAGYGTIDWRIGNSTAGNNYTYPFGTLSGSYVPFLFDLSTAGVQSTAGSMAVATYPTGVTANPNNRPLPTTVGNLNDASGNESAAICADRFWMTNANNYTTIPTANITFNYTNPEWDNSGGSTNNLVEDSLKAWRWNGSQWLNPAMGTDNASANNVSVPSVNTFSIWTLKGAPPCAVSAVISSSATSVTLGNNTNVQITASGGITYVWNPGGATTSSITVSPTATTQYCVTALSASGGCADSTCVTINVEIPCEDFFLPNAFSPNGDGRNEFFKPRGTCIKTLDFRVYNRWGNMVYASTSPTDIGWDGTTPQKGKDGNEGVYAYELNATLLNGTTIIKKGTVTLLK